MLKAGIVGCGGIAGGKHLPALKRVGGVDIVAFCDLVEEKAKKVKEEFGTEDARIYTNYMELLEKETEIDVLYVLTPNRSHCEISVAGLKAGKHVMCEKPMAASYEEAKLMCETAKETGKILTVGYQNRYRADSTYLNRSCKAGDLGDIYYAKAHAIRRRAVPTWGVFLNEYEQGGGPLIDIGTHALDLTLWMLDNYEPAMVVGSVFKKLGDQRETGNAWGDWNVDEFTVEDSAFGFVKMKNGATIYLESSWALNSLEVDEAKTSLCGTLAGADMKDGLRINKVKFGKQVVEQVNLTSGGVAFYEGDAGRPEDIEQTTFINAVTKGTELVVMPEQALVVTQILEAIYESAKTNQPVFFNQ